MANDQKVTTFLKINEVASFGIDDHKQNSFPAQASNLAQLEVLEAKAWSSIRQKLGGHSNIKTKEHHSWLATSHQNLDHEIPEAN